MHDEKIVYIYWCDNCVTPACHECVLVGREHKGHTIRRVADVRRELTEKAAALGRMTNDSFAQKRQVQFTRAINVPCS